MCDRKTTPQDEITDFHAGDSADFSSHITPIIIAAHNEHFELVRLLLSYGHVIKKPHPAMCELHLCISVESLVVFCLGSPKVSSRSHF